MWAAGTTPWFGAAGTPGPAAGSWRLPARGFASSAASVFEIVVPGIAPGRRGAAVGDWLVPAMKLSMEADSRRFAK
jgi:hypothetical protein